MLEDNNMSLYMQMGVPPMHRPIGYWLKHLDNLLEQHFATTLADTGTTRRQWQILNTLATTTDAPHTALTPFHTAGDIDHALTDLTTKGWTTPTPTGPALTPQGHRAHTRITQRITRNRATATAGLHPDDYTRTITVLRTMAANIETDLARHHP